MLLEPKKEINKNFSIILSVVITAIVVGGGVYFWQRILFKNMKRDFNQIIFSMRMESEKNTNGRKGIVGDYKNQLEQFEAQKSDLINKLHEAAAEVQNLNQIIYKGNQLYTKESGDKSIYCTQEPVSTDIGRDVFPIDSKKYGNIEFLGELFTADDCGSERMLKLFGVRNINATIYNLGSNLRLSEEPDYELQRLLIEIGYEVGDTCEGLTDAPACRHWVLKKIVPVFDVLKLKPYANLIESNECVNCG
jgi:hypothetical protein